MASKLSRKSQYELNFKTWGLTKNVKKEEWKYIVARLQEREAQGKRSIVAVNGNAVPKAKIQKQRKLYEYQDTYQRFASSMFPAIFIKLLLS